MGQQPPQLPASGVTLDALTIGHPEAPVLADALTALKVSAQVTLAPAPMLQARLRTPAGPVTLNLPVLDESH